MSGTPLATAALVHVCTTGRNACEDRAPRHRHGGWLAALTSVLLAKKPTGRGAVGDRVLFAQRTIACNDIHAYTGRLKQRDHFCKDWVDGGDRGTILQTNDRHEAYCINVVGYEHRTGATGSPTGSLSPMSSQLTLARKSAATAGTKAGGLSFHASFDNSAGAIQSVEHRPFTSLTVFYGPCYFPPIKRIVLRAK